MAGGLFSRRHATIATNARPMPASPSPAGTPMLRAIEELRRQAEWEFLSPDERATLLTPYAVPREQSTAAESVASDPLDSPWVASLVAKLQPRALSAIQSWLRDGSPDAHLFVMGTEGRGRLTLLTTLLRDAMANRPEAPDLLYVPDAAAPHEVVLLALPTGTATAFAAALTTYLRIVKHAYWDDQGQLRKAASDATHRGDTSDAEADAEADAETETGTTGDDSTEDTDDDNAASATPQPEIVYMRALKASAPVEAHAYLDRLLAFLRQAISSPLKPGFASPEPLEPSSAYTARQRGAPVVVALRVGNEVERYLLRANGGVLVLSADDIANTLDGSSDTWVSLRAALTTQQILPHGYAAPPVPLAVRVVLVGSYDAFQHLINQADDFKRLFRSVARFQDEIAWTREGEAAYAALAQYLCAHERLPLFDASGVAALVEHGARELDARNRAYLTANLRTLRDYIVDAGHAVLDASSDVAATIPAVTRGDVEAVLARRVGEQGELAHWALEHILTGMRPVPTAGAEIGAITGLSVFDRYPMEASYGTPFRLSIAVGPGREERLIDIEREANAADATHHEGRLTMIGFLTWRYGREHPISVVARLRDEQSTQVAGPSASAAELFMLLSALADEPISCARAVTGAVGQHGDIQAIGGVNEKVEGFFALCQARWNAGERPPHGFGMLIPASNAQELMLRPSVARAIAEQNWFAVFPIKTIDEGIPLLMNAVASDLHARVARRLRAYFDVATRMRG